MRLSLQGVACDRGEQTVFADVNLDLPAGGIAHVRGPNGSGKSSLLAMLAGLIQPSAGSVSLEEGRLGKGKFGDLAALAGHQNALKPALTLRENIQSWVLILGGDANQVEPALDRFGLARRADIPAERCSAGERQRAALARVVASDRPLWLLDEPTASLDDSAQSQLADALRDHAAGGGMAVVALHGSLDPPPAAVVSLSLSGPGR